MAISSNQNASAPADKNKQPPPFVLEVDEEVNSYNFIVFII